MKELPLAARHCTDCVHCYEWSEYGNTLYDCGYSLAWEFIGQMEDPTEDAAQAGCPHFEQFKGGE